MHKKIMDIQNSFWKAYTDFRETKDMAQYNADTKQICKRYRFDPVMLSFCQNLFITWVPIINGMKEVQ